MRFALIGAAGYIAPRHMNAIKETGNELVAAMDPHDSVGILDSYFKECDFFTEIEQFDRHLEKLRRDGEGVDYISICSPNYLHDAHCRLALRLRAHAICEKPLVLSPWNIDQLSTLEKEYDRKIYTTMQLRLHPKMIELKKEIETSKEYYRVNIDYNTPRGNWYHTSWKGDYKKSGGLLVNIGIHLFDLVTWLFGTPDDWYNVDPPKDETSGFIVFENARVDWRLGTRKDKPAERVFNINGEDIDLSTNFTELHTRMYRNILNDNSTGIEDARPAIDLTYSIRRGHYGL